MTIMVAAIFAPSHTSYGPVTAALALSPAMAVTRRIRNVSVVNNESPRSLLEWLSWLFQMLRLPRGNAFRAVKCGLIFYIFLPYPGEELCRP